jgi:hypothetical protein
MYTKDKKVMRTAECCKPYSLKKVNLISIAVSQTAHHWLRVKDTVDFEVTVSQ